MSTPDPSGSKPTTVRSFGDSYEVLLAQTNPGQRVEYRGRNSSAKKTVTVDREWDVFLPDGTFIGSIRYAMITRESRSGNRTYVNSRWKSPGWEYAVADGSCASSRFFEGYSKGYSVERLISEHRRGEKS